MNIQGEQVDDQASLIPAVQAEPDPTQVIFIRPTNGLPSLHLGELWHYRELVYFLIWRDVKVRYKQTALGAAWAVIQPLLAMLIFTVFFGRLAKVPSDNLPYPLFAYCALVPWTFFATGLTMGSNSLVEGANLLRKVYFPRMVMPLSSVLAGLVDFSIAFVVLLGMVAFYGRWPGLNVLWLPPLLLLGLMTALGVSLWLSALNVEYRDVRHTIPFIIQIWMFASPVAYPASLVPSKLRPLYGINPMVGVVEGFRWALLGAHTRPGPVVIVSVVASLSILISGALYFRRMEKTFADVV
jgi:lipopolysaccharide transport system permease protein